LGGMQINGVSVIDITAKGTSPTAYSIFNHVTEGINSQFVLLVSRINNSDQNGTYLIPTN